MQEDKESNEEQKKIQEEQAKSELKFNFFRFLISLWNYNKEVLSIRDGVDYEGTVEGIKRDIDFKGYNVWILICSIFIASIGLNLNNYALIIGAMLISPLMGPIVGAGYAVGTNNWQTLLRSLKSFSVAVGISVLTSTIYFLLTPFGDVQSEIINRTRPTTFDVLVATFGGIAGIVAGSRKEKSNVIPGVAIATALMPPLCTAGYALAHWNISYFLGAFYLFIINSVFISLSTFVVVKYLRFPLHQFLDPNRAKKIKRYIVIFVLILIVPSGFTFYDLYKESVFKNNAKKFVKETFVFEESRVDRAEYKYTGDVNTIEVKIRGLRLDDSRVNEVNKRLANYKLEGTELILDQPIDFAKELDIKFSEKEKQWDTKGKVDFLTKEYESNKELIKSSEHKIAFLENELYEIKKDTIPYEAIKKEMHVLYTNVKAMSFGKTVMTDFSDLRDTIPTFYIQWDEKINGKEIQAEREDMEKWLRSRLNDNKVKVVIY